jgi:hypothetical protein
VLLHFTVLCFCISRFSVEKTLSFLRGFLLRYKGGLPLQICRRDILKELRQALKGAGKSPLLLCVQPILPPFPVDNDRGVIQQFADLGLQSFSAVFHSHDSLLVGSFIQIMKKGDFSFYVVVSFWGV